MTRAIYTAAKDGKVIAQRDALIWARLSHFAGERNRDA